MHLSEAEMIMKALQKKGFSLDEDWKNLFRLGNLLPDTRRKTEKVTSHFWNRDTLDHLAIPPQLSAFEKKYGHKISDPLMFGYWTHLQLDEDYVNQFWPSMMRFTDENDQEQAEKERICYIHLLKRNRKILRDEFFSSAYYYGDFDRTNHLFYRKYQVQVPTMPDVLTCPVEEVEVSDLMQVLEEIRDMLQQNIPESGETALKVFQLEDLEDFLSQTARKAAESVPEAILAGW